VIVARHIKNPIDTSVYNQNRPGRQFYSSSFESQVALIVRQETGTNPLKDNGYRGKDVMLARQLYLFMMKCYSGDSLRSVGKTVCKDHATVIHAVKAINDRYDTDKKFKAIFDKVNVRILSLNP
jgi:hypothetical protein